MELLTKPFERLWHWVDQMGGYPGKLLFCCVIVMAVVAGLTWYSNKR